MADRLLDPDAEAQGAPCEGVEHVHEVSVVRREASVCVHPLKVWASRVQTYRSEYVITCQSTDLSRGPQEVIRSCFTSYPPNFICHVAAGKSGHMSTEAVANQMDVLNRGIGGFLQRI